MNWNPSLKPTVNPSIEDVDCSICLEKIVSEDQAPSEGEKSKTLDCSHIFHRECIGSWLQRKNDCPLCRKVVKVDKPESSPSEALLREIQPVPDHQQIANVEQENIRGILFVIRANILETRRVRIINLDENTQVSITATKVHVFALKLL